MNQRAEKAASTLLSMGCHTHLTGSTDQLLTRQLINGIAIGGSEGIPQSAPLVIRPKLSDLNRQNFGPRQHDTYPAGLVVQIHLRPGVEIGPGHDLPRDHDQGALGRAQPPVLIHDYISHRCLAGHELCDRADPFDNDAMGDFGLTAAWYQATGSWGETLNGKTDENQGPTEERERN